MTTLSVSSWTKFPGPRYIIQGDWSGEAYRKEVLLSAVRKAIENNEKLEIDLEGTLGYGSSFLDEAFAGLIRMGEFKKEEILNTLVFKSNTIPAYKEEAMQYITEAGGLKY